MSAATHSAKSPVSSQVNRKTKASLALLLLALLPQCPFAATVRIDVRDSATGIRVLPTNIQIDSHDTTVSPQQDGSLLFNVPDGEHDAALESAGYLRLNGRLTVTGADTPNYEFLLDRAGKAAPVEPVSQSTNLTPQKDSATLIGYVTDAQTAQPIEGAGLTVEGTNLHATTDSFGRFVLSFDTSKGTSLAEDEQSGHFLKTDLLVSKTGYGACRVADFVLIGGVAVQHNVRLSRTAAATMRDVTTERGDVAATVFDGAVSLEDSQTAGVPAVLPTRLPASALSPLLPASLQAPPTSIRVGMSCSCTSCNTVSVMSMDTYTKHVLPAEWISSWRADSLKAGAIAIRSYAGYYVYHPLNATFDICSTTCCQVYGSTTATSSDNAVDATSGQFMVDTSGNIARCEYSAENNDSVNRDGCGNCFTQDKPGDGICLSDSVCCGFTQNGHGRGMCQWGSQRWALNQGKTYDWICDHYFSAYAYQRVNLNIPRSAPTNVQASDATFSNEVRVTWTGVTGATSYNVYRATSNNFASSAFIGTSATTQYDDAGAAGPTTYWYWIEPVNSFGAGPVSSPDSGEKATVSMIKNWEVF